MNQVYRFAWWSFWNVVIALLPVILLIFLLFVFDMPIQWDKVFANAVLVFFAVALCATSLYQLLTPRSGAPGADAKTVAAGVVILLCITVLGVLSYTAGVLRDHNLLAANVGPSTAKLMFFEVVAAVLALAFSWKVESI